MDEWPDDRLRRAVACFGRVRELARIRSRRTSGTSRRRRRDLPVRCRPQDGLLRAHEVDGEGPFEGSELMWMLGLKAAAASRAFSPPGTFATRARATSRSGFAQAPSRSATPNGAPRFGAISPRASSATTAAPRTSCSTAAGGLLGGDDGLLERLRALSRLLRPAGEEGVPVREDRRAARLVRRPGPRGVGGLGRQRPHAARASLGAGRPGPARPTSAPPLARRSRSSRKTEISPPVLDDMLWELGRGNPDLLGRGGRPGRASTRPGEHLVLRGPAQDVESVGGGRSAKKKNQTAIATMATTSEPTRSGSSGPRMQRGSSSSGASSISRMRRGIVIRM